MAERLPAFHPMTVLRDWSRAAPGACYRIVDSLSHCLCVGATGSGKSTGPMTHACLAYLAHGYSLCVLSSKNETAYWEKLAEQTGRWNRETKEGDVVIFDTSGRYRFNFLEWEARRSKSQGGGLTINIVNMLDEIAGAITGSSSKSPESSAGDNKWFQDALHDLNTNIVDSISLAGLPVTMRLMRAVVSTAPLSIAEAQSDQWLHGTGECAALLREGDRITADAAQEVRSDFEACREYWTREWPSLSDRTRSIVQLSFSMLVRPFITRPLGPLFSTTTNITPEEIFDKGKILVVDINVQQYRLVGKIANIVWKYCFQIASLSRVQPTGGTYLRPSVLVADEYQTFATKFDAEWCAVSRQSASSGLFAVQNRESLVRELGNVATVDSLLGNMQVVFLGQNSSVSTNDWGAKLIGERWVPIVSVSAGRNNPQAPDQDVMLTRGVTSTEQRRYYFEPSRFNGLKRGGPKHDYQVECVVYNGGTKFEGTDEEGRRALLPYLLLTFNQRNER